MVDNSSHPNHSVYGQGSNIPSNIHTPIPAVGGSSQPGPKLAYEVTYEQLQAVQPITCRFAKAISVLHIAHNLPRHPKKKETTCNSV